MTNRQMPEIIRRQKPMTLRPTVTVQEACRRMHERRIGAVLNRVYFETNSSTRSGPRIRLQLGASDARDGTTVFELDAV